MSWDALGTSVLLNGGVALGVFFIFNYLRRMPFLAEFYAAKRKLSIPFRCVAFAGVSTCLLVGTIGAHAMLPRGSNSKHLDRFLPEPRLDS